jgi:hypothetical protein
MTRLPLIRLVFILTIILYITGCSVSDSFKPLDESPLITGEINEIEKTEHGFRVLISENGEVQNEDVDFRFVWFFITDRTEVLIQQKNGLLKQISRENLETGQRAEGWGTGAFTQTPLEGEARRIVVVEE